MDTPLEKPKPQIQVKQVHKNRPKLGRGRAGMCHKTHQPIADTLVSPSKSPKIPTIQKVVKDNMDFPVPEQLITKKTETISKGEIQGKIKSNLFIQIQFIDLIDNLWPKSPETNTSINPKKILNWRKFAASGGNHFRILWKAW